MKTVTALAAYAKRKINFGRAVLTADDARFICENMAFERQRDIDARHVANLADSLDHNEWIGMSMLVFGNYRHQLKLVDGQHRLMAHAEHGRRHEVDAPREYVIQVVPGDAAVAYAHLDARQKKRASHVVAQALALDVPAVFARHALDAAATAARYMSTKPLRVEVGNSTVIVDYPYRDCVDYVAEHREDFVLFAEAFEELTFEDRMVKSALLRRSVLPICIETIAAKREDALKFWRAVLSGENPTKASRYIREHMLQKLPTAGHKTPLIRALTAAIGWNGHVTGSISRTRSNQLAVKETPLIVH